MEYFDVHAHIFPDKIAAKVVAYLESYYGLPWGGDGTPGDLLASMDRAGVGRAMVLSCATKAEQVTAANDYLGATQQQYPDRFCALGTLHPDFQDFRGELARMKKLGLRGLKLHPDFQRVYIDELKMMRIYGEIGDDFPILFHIGDSRTDFSSPWRLARVLDTFPHLKIIAAHFGGYSEWGEVWKHLVGRKLWFDTSSTLWRLPVEEARKIACAHGVDKLLFASDYPAVDHKKAIGDVLALGFSPEENEAIFHINAEKLFGFV